MTGLPSLLSRLYQMRHGEFAWSLSGQHTGRTGILLSEQGERPQGGKRLCAGPHHADENKQLNLEASKLAK